jgi:hypothetical protein
MSGRTGDDSKPYDLQVWSGWRDSNPRPPAPNQLQPVAGHRLVSPGMAFTSDNAR